MSEDKYANQYAEEGLDVDIDVDVEIVKSLLTKSKENKDAWDDPWLEKQELQYCSQIPNCWNKRIIEQESSSKPSSTKSTHE
jgi:hypothetical protein